MTLDQFVATYSGKSVDVDGAYGPQCWDLAAEYSRSVVGVPGDSFPYGLPTGDGTAAGVFAHFQEPLPQYYDRIANDPNNSNQVPARGDIIVFDYSSPGSGGSGHIGVVLSANATNFTSFDQNWGKPIAQQVTHNYNYILGWLRPKEGEHMGVITTEAVVALSLGTQGTQPQSPDEYAQWVGKSDQQSWDDLITHYSAKGKERQAALEAEVAALKSASSLVPYAGPQLFVQK